MSFTARSSPSPGPIVLVTNGRNRGGTEDHVLQVGAGLVRRGFSVVAIMSTRPDIAWLADELEAAGVEVRRLDERGGGRLAPIRRTLALRSALRDTRSGILHLQFNGHPSGELTMLAARLARLKVIVRTDHNPPLPKLTRRERWSLKVRDRYLSRIIVISEQDRRWYHERLGRDLAKLRVIPHGIDLDLYRPDTGTPVDRSALGIPAGAVVAGNVANLGESKGTGEFLEMAEVLARENPAMRFLIIGGGPELDDYRARAARLAAANQIIFAGHIEKGEVPRYLALMDIVVLPSLQESGPYTVLEAMSFGLPVVATRVGFVPELIIDGVNGLSVDAGDAAALAVAVQSLVDDPAAARDMAGNGQRMVRAERSTDAMVDRIVGVYEELGVAAPQRVASAAQ
jgi:glycosyltransferase involved in cell wall biosynthesis